MKKKWKYFLWKDPNMGLGEGPAVVYIRANTKEGAKARLKKIFGFKDDPDFIDGDVKEVKEFIQPKEIPVI